MRINIKPNRKNQSAVDDAYRRSYNGNKKRRNRFRMKDRIIKESISSLRREGLRFSVDTLAERLCISKKTIYKFFPDKESLAFAMYQNYYDDIKAQAAGLASESSGKSRFALLYLYYDAKSMTCGDIFNKYKLNEALYSYTAKQNDELLDIIFRSFNGSISDSAGRSLRLIINGAFEKLCNEKISPEGVIDRLVGILW